MLEVKNIYKNYRTSLFGSADSFEKADPSILKGVSFQMGAGEWVGLVGESGSGKSTLSRLILGLEKPDCGEIWLEGKKVSTWIKENKGQMSVVFQDYQSSVNPAFQVKDIINEPLQALKQHIHVDETVESLMEKVALPRHLADRYPHELSGGQLQRVCIARAISSKPKWIVMDEAISSLDVSVQTQILELLDQLKKELNMACLFIAHDLQTVAYLCDQVMFLHEGTIVEQVETSNLAYVKSDYAKRLLDSVIRF